MRNLVLVFTLLILNSDFNIRSQDRPIKDKLFESNTKVVFGYSSDFPSLDLGITFRKVITLKDTIYFIKFHLITSTSDIKRDIYLSKKNNLIFLSKSGKTVNLNFDDDLTMDENEEHKGDPFNPARFYYYSATFYIKVTKDQLTNIGSEPFYNLFLTYTDKLTKRESKAVFIKPTLFTRRIFTQSDTKYILEI